MSSPALLILLHGNFASPRWWQPVRQQLSGNVTTLAPDMRLWIKNGQTTIPSLAGRLGEFIQAHGLARPVIIPS